MPIDRLKDLQSPARDGVLPTRRLFGLDFVSDSGVDDVVDWILSREMGPGSPYEVVVTPNVDHIVRYDKYASERRVAEQASIVLPDGAPVVWCSRILRRPLASRVAGSDLYTRLWPALRDGKRSVLLVAANEAVAASSSNDYPDADVIVAPVLGIDDVGALRRFAEHMRLHLEGHPAEVLLLTIGTPKAHRLVGALLEAAPPAPGGPTILILGASPEFHFGLKRRAPRWMQAWGLEWAHRLAADPVRLARRYLVDDLRFLPIVWREWRSPRRSSSQVSNASVTPR